MASLALDFRIQVSTKMALNTTRVQGSDRMVANHAMLTMGGRMYHFEGEIGKDGVLDVQHTFQPITNDQEPSYYNQIEWKGEVTKSMRQAGVQYNDPDDTKIKSHAILWMFRTYTEITSRSGAVGGVVKRCVLLGSLAIDLEALMQAVISVNTEAGPSTVYSKICCKHNFCSETFCECTLLAFDKDADKRVEAVKTSLAALRAGLEWSIKSIKGLQMEGKQGALGAVLEELDGEGAPMYMRSPLADMNEINEIVHMQQGIMTTYCALAINQNEMEFGDEMSAAFVSGATFCQLYGAAVCFTDMTQIVRDRVAEYPFELVCNMTTIDDAERLLDVYKSTITCELMDSRQSEYFSDYCLFGMEHASDADYFLQRQPMRGYDPADTIGERWVYVEMEGQKVKMRLRQSEDQRQVCTGRDLRDGIIADDCETSASMIKGEHKTLMLMKAYLEMNGVISADTVSDKEFLKKLSSDDFFKEIAGVVERLAPAKRFLPDHNTQPLDVEDMILVPTGAPGDSPGARGGAETSGNLRERTLLVLALANIVRQFDLRLDLCMGTANAAGVGQENHVCGHCYLICGCEHIQSGLKGKYIVEGTNWVMQKKDEECVIQLTEQDYTMLNEISTILMEVTKVPTHTPSDDVGKSLVKMSENRRGSFYMNVYVCGDSLHLGVLPEKTHNGDQKLVFGVPVQNVVNEHDVRKIPMGYVLVCEHLRTQAGKIVNPMKIMNAVKEQARAETIPPWPKKKWDALMNTFLPSNTRYLNNECTFDEAKDLRIVFVHQLCPNIQSGDVWEFVHTILDVLVKGKEPGITKRHEELLLKPDEILGTQPEIFNSKVANASLQGVEKNVCVQRIYTSMSNVVTVCIVKKEKMASLHAQLLGWAQVIVSARRNKDIKVQNAMLNYVKNVHSV